MRKKLLIAILLLMSFFTANTYAETAYQKEVNRIVEKYYSINKYGYARSLSFNESMSLAFVTPNYFYFRFTTRIQILQKEWLMS